MKKNKVLSARNFSRQSGVSVRTLHAAAVLLFNHELLSLSQRVQECSPFLPLAQLENKCVQSDQNLSSITSLGNMQRQNLFYLNFHVCLSTSQLVYDWRQSVKRVVAFHTVLGIGNGVIHHSSLVANSICLVRKVLFISLNIKLILVMQHKPVHASFKSTEKALHKMKLIKEKCSKSKWSLPPFFPCGLGTANCCSLWFCQNCRKSSSAALWLACKTAAGQLKYE